ncbi:MAG TPA: hypothetical protein VGI40_01720 [Pirellulaceae bacterium]|jgi:hypothetical protein
MSNIREVFLPHLNRTVKLGRRQPIASQPRMPFARYAAAPPSPPASIDYSGPARNSLSRVYLNDQLGCCVISCMAHVEGVLTANAGSERIFTDTEITALYSAIGGYVPGNPNTDQGCDEQTALAYWQNHGAGDDKIIGSLALDPTNPTEYRTAIWLFENAVYGIPLPDKWLRNPQPGFVWDQGRPDPNNGHCIAAFGYNAQGTLVDSWGMLGQLTDAAHRVDVQEMYVVLSKNSLARASQKAPNGFDWATLVGDFNALGGHVAPPPPDPTPTPTPPAPNSNAAKIAGLEILAKLLGLPVHVPPSTSDTFSV